MAQSKNTSGRRIGDRTRDLSRAIARPTPEHSRLTRFKSVQLLLRVGGATVALAAMFSLFVFPVRDYVSQSGSLTRKLGEIEALAEANEQLQNEVNDLATPEGIRNAARSQLGYVLPGEQRIALAPMPDLPTVLPNTWPYTLISDIVTIRANVVATTKDPLAPLGP
jgi:hypothetical protein